MFLAMTTLATLLLSSGEKGRAAGDDRLSETLVDSVAKPSLLDSPCLMLRYGSVLESTRMPLPKSSKVVVSEHSRTAQLSPKTSDAISQG